MRDALEERLATRLREVGDLVDDDLPPPADLEIQVRRHRRRTRSTRRWTGLAVAAAVATVAVVHTTTGHDTIRVATSPTTAAGPQRDGLRPGTVMLSSRGPFVLSLDATGTQNATMVTSPHEVVYARATDDHRAIWYLSMKNGPKACGEVVRANIDGQGSKLVTEAEAFDVSPDGTRLALYGAGDLANGQCSQVKAGALGQIAVVDVASFESSTLRIGGVTGLRWSPDGSSLIAVTCPAGSCAIRRIPVPAVLGAPLAAGPGPIAAPARTIHSARIAFGPDGLYALERTNPLGWGTTALVDTIDRFDPSAPASPTVVFSGGTTWRISQVIPTSAGVYVVAAHVDRPGSVGLYRVSGAKLVAIEQLFGPGTITPVTPLAAAG